MELTEKPILLKEGLITYSSGDEWMCHVTQGHVKSTRFGQVAERNKRIVQSNTSVGFSAEKARQGRINS